MTQNISPPEEYPLLQEGSTSEEVVLLQEKLKVLGYYPGTVTRSFGRGTTDALMAFQQANGLPSTGLTTLATWEALYAQTEPVLPRGRMEQAYPTLELGSSGSEVVELQEELKHLTYYDHPVTGVYDENTQHAVQRFQINNRLTADGITGPSTWRALNTLYAPLAICGGEGGEEGGEDDFLYTVQAGDTLYRIAQRYGTTVDAIKQLNGLSSDALYIGQQLLIPYGNGETPPTQGTSTYTVQAGDTLYRIAQRYGTTVDTIKQLNGLSSNALYIGQQLLIPASGNGNTITYTVRAGDSLYSIAQRYGITVDAIKQLNGLSSNNLYIGQQLLIPTSGNGNTITYTVRAGDSLYSIAQRYGITVDAIKQLNGLSSNNLYIGQQLLIPA
ncbi:LysM peptidoglycan-binding domain-containing protein [Clostridia bacterium OttesenSCG-928-F22]|nr:LysM peptidoglycan-binding domain-containing protein [Clostridia bacterium OttesenSCG-928-F22]